jgi:hypothetical protein
VVNETSTNIMFSRSHNVYVNVMNMNGAFGYILGDHNECVYVNEM